MRFHKPLTVSGSIDNEGNLIIPDQAEGDGGFMLDASIGKQFSVGRNKKISVNLSLSNLLNNTSLVSGGYEQSRSNYTVNNDGTLNNVRTYKFSKNPKKYYAQGFNGMLNINYRF